MAGAGRRAALEIVGLHETPHAQSLLKGLYEQTLAELGKLPGTQPYVAAVTQMTNQRLEAVTSSSDLAELETKLGLGRAEEAVELAQEELKLVPQVARWNGWVKPDSSTS